MESKIRILVGFLEKNDYILIAHINQTSYPQQLTAMIEGVERWVSKLYNFFIICHKYR